MTTFEINGTNLRVNEGVFNPTLTSTLIIEYLKTLKGDFSSALDLGCGSGIVALMIKNLGVSNIVCGSDISEPAVNNFIENADLLGYEIEGRTSSLFESWGERKFDLIVNDVSGISQTLAPLTDWFSDKISCETGEEGISLTMEIIRKLDSHLEKGGVFITPLLGLSNYKKPLELLRSKFNSVELVSTKKVYLPPEFPINNPLFQKLLDDGIVEIDKQFGLYMWSIYLYVAKNGYLN